MKRMTFIIILFFAGIASANKVRDWVLAQEYNKTQLQDVTRQAVRNKAEQFEFSEPQIRRLMGSYHTLLNAAWSDWRQRRIETARRVLESKVHEYAADAIVLYVGQQRSSIDPNSMSSMFTVEVDLELER